jgi:hypothetical protein
MNRELKFKGKLENYYGVIDKEWITFELFDIFNYNDPLSKTIVAQPLCQLIATINDVEIYEYDCYFDVKKNRIEYFSYELNGQLGVQSYSVKNNKLEHIHYTLNLEVVKCLRKSILKNDYINIGNWHDGEEYLLNKIKEVENEN